MNIQCGLGDYDTQKFYWKQEGQGNIVGHILDDFVWIDDGKGELVKVKNVAKCLKG